ELNPVEADVLQGLLNGFPFTGARAAAISISDEEAGKGERTQLLNEALAEHRKELKKVAAKILGKMKRRKTGWRLSLDVEERELLLQILNDIRVGCWHALGAPASLDTARPAGAQELSFRNWMDLAGYFEQSLIEAE
ncbi:MAG TPA: hypothetical protein VF988_00025, partial [Verrucomicrobiae bacterium]